MKRLLFTLFITLVLWSGVKAEENGFAPATNLPPANYTLFKSATETITIIPDDDVLYSGTWYNTSLDCSGTFTNSYSADAYEHRVRSSTSGTLLTSWIYTPSSVTSKTYYQARGSYALDADDEFSTCTIGSTGSYSNFETWTITVVDPTATGLTVCEASSANLNDRVSLSGFTFKEGGVTIVSPESYTVTAGTHTITATKLYANGTKTLTFDVIGIDVPTTPSGVTNEGTYCGAQTDLTLTATGSTSSNGTVSYYWYSAASGGTLLKSNSATYTVSPSLTIDYYVESRASLTSVTCTNSTRYKATVTINAIPTTPTDITGGGSLCETAQDGSKEVTLEASGSDAGMAYKYYNDATAGTMVNDGATWTKTWDVGAYTYYVEASNTTTGCVSAARKQVDLTIKDRPSITITNTTGSYCVSQGSIDLNTESGVDPTNGTWSGSPNLSGAIFSFVASGATVLTYTLTENGCDETVTFTATINDNPTVPTTVSGGDYCGEQELTLTASGMTAGAAYTFYSAAIGGVVLNVGEWTEIFAVGTHSYFVETELNGCKSSSRMEGTLTINEVPGAPVDITTDTGCNNDTPAIINLVVQPQSGGTIDWYENDETTYITTSGTYSPSVSVTTTYKAREVLNGCKGPFLAVDATIHPDPTAPTAVDNERCGEGVVTIEVADISGTDYRWYTSEFGGGEIGSGELTYTTSSLTADQIYWFEYTDDKGCNLSARIPVHAYIRTVPTEAVINDVHRCEAGTVTFEVVNPETGFTYEWYEVASEGTVLSTGTSYASDILTADKTYYVETISDYNCNAIARTTVTAFVETNPGAPTALDQSVCTTGSLILEAAGKPTDGTYRWYDSESNFLEDGDTYTTGDLISDTTFFVSALSQYGCESTKDIVSIIIDTVIPEPTLTGDQVCVNGIMTLSATGGEVGDVYNWYDSDISGFPAFTGASFETADLDATTTYWAAIERPSGCEGPRVSIDATVNDLPTISVGSDVYLCAVSDTYDLSLDESPTGGTWTGTGVSGSIFYATTSGAGVFTLQYDYTDPLTGCSDSSLKTVSVAQTIVVDAGSDLAVCPESGTIDLVGQGFSPAGGVWSSADSLVNTKIVDAARTLDVDGLDPGTYPIAYTVDASGCESIDQFELTIYANPNEPTIQEGGVCGSGAVELQLLGAATGEVYHWYDSLTATTSFNTGGSFVTPTITQPQTYYVSLINSTTSCEGARIPITANVFVVPTINAGPDLLVCDPATIDLTNNPDLLGGDWSGPGIAGNLWSPTGLIDGEHIITYTYQTADGCTTADSRIFTIGLEGEVNITADDLSINEPIYFSSSFTSEDIKNIEWLFGDNFNSYQTEPIHYYYVPGIFDVSYTIELNNGCQGTFSFPAAVSIGGDPIGVIVGVDDPGELKETIAVYPTMVDNRLSLQYNGATKKELKLSILSSKGVLFTERTINVQKGVIEIDLSNDIMNLSPQLYYIVINDQVVKIIKK